MWAPKCMERLACRTEIGALSQMACAVASVSSISFSGAQSLLTMPQSSASCARERLAGEDDLLGAAQAGRARQELRAAARPA